MVMRSRRHGARPGWMALVAALVVVSTACGSNLPHGVQQAVQSASPGVGGSGLSSPLPAGAKVTKAGKIVNKAGAASRFTPDPNKHNNTDSISTTITP